MKINKIRIKLSLGFFCQFFLLSLVASVFILSASHGFIYFVDSKTYLNRVVYEYFVTEISYFYPLSTFLIALLNAYLVYCISKLYPVISFLVFFSPYQLLLIMNLSKESVFFLAISVFAYYANKSVGWLKYSPMVFLFSRPVYLFLYFIRPNLLPTLIISMVLIFYLFPDVLEYLLSNLIRRTSDRDLVTHNNGREFFSYYCVAEKNNFFEMIACLIPGIFLVPNHSSFSAVDYFIFVSFHVSFWVVSLKLFKRKMFFHFGVFLFSYFFIFLMSPTFGAFVRYFYPNIWLFGARAYFIRDR